MAGAELAEDEEDVFSEDASGEFDDFDDDDDDDGIHIVEIADENEHTEEA